MPQVENNTKYGQVIQFLLFIQVKVILVKIFVKLVQIYIFVEDGHVRFI